MDYEKKYKEAQKWIESIYSELSHEQQMEAEAFFPELKESEDERIRKEIIATIHLYYGEPLEDEAKEMIAWLEKQGKNDILEDAVVDSNDDGLIADALRNKKIEPKFKVGNWITNGDYTWKIIEVKPLDYILQSQDGNIVDDTISHVDGQFHSFTTEDAKDGDVLACTLPKGCESGEQIFIFKCINSRDYVDNCIEYYCRVYEGVFYENENGNGYMGTTSSPLYPATKEQRNLLFQKIKDAGYKWDEGKKELRKIEYTRADAFIEKAVKFMEKIDDVDEYSWYNEEEHAAGITEKCIEDFKKYMKGE